MWVLLLAVSAIVLLVGYVAWRDRRRGRGTGTARTGTARAAAEGAQTHRGASDLGGL